MFVWWVFVLLALLLRLALIEFPSPRALYYLFKIPGPWGLPLIGSGLRLALQPPEGLEGFGRWMMSSYKRMCGMTFSGQVYISLFEAQDIAHLLGGNTNLDKGFEYECVRLLTDGGLFGSNSDRWTRDRPLMVPGFHVKRLEEALTVMTRESRKMASLLEATRGQPTEVLAFALESTFSIIVETGLGVKLDDLTEEKRKVVNIMTYLEEKVIDRVTKVWLINPFIYWMTSHRRQVVRKLRIFNKFINEVIQTSKQELKDQKEAPLENSGKIKSFMECLLEVQGKVDSFTDVDIESQMKTFLMAGHDTTATSISFLLFFLGHHPDVQERVYDEIVEVLGDENVDLKNSKQLVYLDMVIKETLRLYPSAPYMSRRLTKDILLDDGTLLPVSSTVSVIPFLVHRNEKHFPDPEKFDPDRFLPERTAARHPYAYLPFSAGPRNCIGKKFALLELFVLAVEVLRKVRVEAITSREEVLIIPTIGLKPVKPFYCRFYPRTSQ